MALQLLNRNGGPAFTGARQLRRTNMLTRLQMPQDSVAGHQLPTAAETGEGRPGTVRAHRHVRLHRILEDFLAATAWTRETFVAAILALVHGVVVVRTRRDRLAAARAWELRAWPQRAELREMPHDFIRPDLVAAPARA